MIQDDMPPVYVIGAPRSGTTFLQAMLGGHPAIATTVELTLFNAYVPLWQKIWDREAAAIREGRWTQGLPHIWKEEDFAETIRSFLDRAYRALHARKPGARVLIDKQPDYSFHLDLIKKWVPGAKFVHIIRDGRDVAASMVAVHKRRGVLEATVPAAARRWRDHVVAARGATRFGANRYFEVRYEDMLASGAEKLFDLLRFCGVDSTEEEAAAIREQFTFEAMKAGLKMGDPAVKTSPGNFHRGTAGGWREDLSAADRYDFDRIAGDLLVELGYAERGWWAEGIVDRIAQPLRWSLAFRAEHLRKAVRHAGAAFVGPNIADLIRGATRGR